MTTKVPGALRPFLKKRWIWTLASVTAAVILFAIAWNIEYEKPVSPQKLPEQAQAFLSQHYQGEIPVLVKWDLDELQVTYDVTFRDATTVVFRRNGEWQTIKGRSRPVPQAAVPPQITSYAAQSFPGATITEIEHRCGMYEVELNNMVELTFDDKKFALRGYDD